MGATLIIITTQDRRGGGHLRRSGLDPVAEVQIPGSDDASPSPLDRRDGEGADAERILKLMEVLEELEDVSRVSSNFDIDAAQLAEAEA